MSLSMEDRGKIDLAVSNVAASLFPDVVRMRWSIEEDHDGEPAVFYRIVLSDAWNHSRLSDLCSRVTCALYEAVDVDAMGLLAYHNYRTVSEQARRKGKEPEWEEAA